MKKLLTQTFVLATALTISVTTFAQSPNNTTRQRRTAGDGVEQAADTNPTTATDKTPEVSADKDKTKPPEVTPDGKTNRADDGSDRKSVV